METDVNELGNLELDLNAESIPLSAQISAALFVSAKPVAISDLAEATGYSDEEVEEVLEQLVALYQAEVHGIYLAKVQDGYQLRTAPGALPLLRKLVPSKTKKFSKAAAETLAVIAYKQPVQRAEIEAIRGVDALPTLKTLLEAKVIRVIGRDNEIGKPALYATTEKFLERFGLKDLSELPTTREIQELESEPGEAELEGTSSDEIQDADSEADGSEKTFTETQETTIN
jgi:segregation and condensation protein B